MPDIINYTIREFEGIKVIDFSGNLSSNTVRSFDTIVKSIAEKESVILNMANVNIITTTGINSIIDVSHFAKDYGKRVIVLWPSSNLLEIVTNLAAHGHLIFADSLEEGRTKIKYYT